MLLAASVRPAADANAAAAAGATTRRSPGNSRNSRSIVRLSLQARDRSGSSGAEDGFPEEEWRACLDGTARHMVVARRTFGLLPVQPEMQVLQHPVPGPGGFVLRHISDKYGPWDKNPNLCRRCVIGLGSADVMGAEVDVSFLFADIRRSSDLAREMGNLEFTHLMQRFYTVATEVLFAHEALLDKFVGDEVVGFFLPFMAGDGTPPRGRGGRSRPLRGGGLRFGGGTLVSRSARASTRAPRSSATSREGRRASSPRSATRSTWRRTWRRRRRPGRS